MFEIGFRWRPRVSNLRAGSWNVSLFCISLEGHQTGGISLLRVLGAPCAGLPRGLRPLPGPGAAEAHARSLHALGVCTRSGSASAAGAPPRVPWAAARSAPPPAQGRPTSPAGWGTPENLSFYFFLYCGTKRCRLCTGNVKKALSMRTL